MGDAEKVKRQHDGGRLTVRERIARLVDADSEVATEVVGTVWRLLVGVGDTVAAEQELAIVESMKMEIPVSAPVAATVHRVSVAEGEAVAEGQALIVLDTG